MAAEDTRLRPSAPPFVISSTYGPTIHGGTGIDRSNSLGAPVVRVKRSDVRTMTEAFAAPPCADAATTHAESANPQAVSASGREGGRTRTMGSSGGGELVGISVGEATCAGPT